MASKKIIEEVWNKGKAVRNRNPDTWRRDEEGNLIRKGSYGTQGEYGWEIDHIRPVAKGGSDDLRNLRPLHHEDNLAKSDKIKK